MELVQRLIIYTLDTRIRDSSPTRQFTDPILETFHQQNWRQFIDTFEVSSTDIFVLQLMTCDWRLQVETIYGPRQANLVLIAYASSEGSGEPAHPRSLARTSAARSYKQWVKRNLQTENQIPGPSEWLDKRS